MTQKKRSKKKTAWRAPIKTKVISLEDQVRDRLNKLLEQIEDRKLRAKLSTVVLGVQKWIPKDFRSALKLLSYVVDGKSAAAESAKSIRQKSAKYLKQIIFTLGVEMRKAGGNKAVLLPLRTIYAALEDVRVLIRIPKV